jgi:penicillin-binding protein 2
MSTDSPRLRMSVLGIVVFSLFAALFARLWYLQVMVTDEFQVVAESNRVREVPVEAPRGRILDRNGAVLVDNRISIQVSIDRAGLEALGSEERLAMLERLAGEFTLRGNPTTVEQLEERIADPRYSPYVPVPVATDVPEELKIWIDEHTDELPAVLAERVAVRTYPYGSIAAHVLGYVGQISEDEFAVREGSQKPYDLNDDIGKAGVEVVYEDVLRGMPGERQIEVDTNGTPVQILDGRDPVPGDDVVLSIDIDVQAVAERALLEGIYRARAHLPPRRAPAGSLVVMDPRDGAIVAMASFPTYDPERFTDGISAAEWSDLTHPESGYPLNNWAIMGQYPPGSTFKLLSGLAALERGLVTPEMPYVDRGAYRIPGCGSATCTWRNSGGRAHGEIDLRRAITVSSNAYFAEIGARFWFEQDQLGTDQGLQEGVEPFGVGQPSGVDLPSERPGRIPNAEWREEFCEQVACIDDGWYPGDNVNMGIGQGDVLMTPLQLANSYATFANGGTRWVPRVASRVLDGTTGQVEEIFEPVAAEQIEIAPDHRDAMLEGLVGVTVGEGGTARTTFATFPNFFWPVAGKTGTAEVNDKDDSALFAAFGPAHNPQYAISVIVEEAGFGGTIAAPVARQIFDVLGGGVEAPPAPLGGTPAEAETPTEDPPPGAED